MRKLTNFIKNNYPFVLFCFIYFSIIAFKVIFKPTPFFDWDESLYIQTGKEMLLNKYFWAPVWQGIPWLDKPPLVPLLYGLIMKIFFFIQPEISTRLFTLTVSIFLLFLIYKLYYRVLKETWTTALVTAATAVTPIFYQRVQVVNLDLYLLLGWVGFLVYFDNFLLSTFFLFIATMSKSLIGFYPVAIVLTYHFYLLVTKKENKRIFLKIIRKLIIQALICSLYFILMLILYKGQFFKQHIIESHFRRVTSSIEFHFGERIYYLTLAFQQFRYLAIIAPVGLIIIAIQFLTKKIDLKNLLYSLYLLPWYLFLNLTKTKIFWYFFSAAPQIALLSIYPASIFRKNKKVYSLIILTLAFIILWNISANNLYQTVFSKNEDYYYLSVYAKNKCSDLSVLLNQENRSAFDTLEKMGLLITTTKWWGNHPSMVYYFGKRVNFFYDTESFDKKIGLKEKQACFVVEKEDYQLKNLRLIKNFGTYLLYSQNRL